MAARAGMADARTQVVTAYPFAVMVGDIRAAQRQVVGGDLVEQTAVNAEL
jgi:hypothetical protein